MAAFNRTATCTNTVPNEFRTAKNNLGRIPLHLLALAECTSKWVVRERMFPIRKRGVFCFEKRVLNLEWRNGLFHDCAHPDGARMLQQFQSRTVVGEYSASIA